MKKIIFSLFLLGTFGLSAQGIYDLDYTSIDGEKVSLSKYKGKKILFVNVASKCGFTPQYKALQELSKKYPNKLVVIGFPSNEFGGQEPGTEAEIKTFCKDNYGVTFPMASKIAVTGDKKHPIYQWLTQKAKNGKEDSSVKWNFQKYIVDEKGEWLAYFYSLTNPMSEKVTNLVEGK